MDVGTLATLALMVGVAGLLTLLIFQQTPRDAVTLLSVYLVALYLLPARLVLKPLGGIGTPAVLIALLATWWWLLGRFNPTLGLNTTRQPLRPVLFIYISFCLFSYSLSQMRHLTEVERTGSIRSVIALLAASGVAMLIADGVGDRRRFDVLVRRLVLVGGLMALVGVIQFATGFDPTKYIRIPGLVIQQDILGVGTRSIFNRPFSTALHPIEYGVVCASLVPVALHVAFYDADLRRRRWAWAAVGVLAASAPMSVSRSAILALLVGFATLSVAWSWRRRLRMGLGGVVFAFGMWAVVPGLLGTIRNLFLNASTDPSITARTERLPRVIELWSESPWVGIGFGTYNLEDYFLLDNEVYRTAIQVGVVGLALTFLVIFAAMGAARGARHRSTDADTRHLGQALAASILALASSMATFDAFYYRILYGTLFLLIGCAGALWFIVKEDSLAKYDPGRKVAETRRQELLTNR